MCCRHTARSAASKLWMNELLENSETPTIWCSNRIEHIDPAILRRFTYVLEVPPPGVRQRARILTRALGVEVRAGEPAVERIAARYDASPAQLVAAVNAARLVAGSGPPAMNDVEERYRTVAAYFPDTSMSLRVPAGVF